MRELSVDVSSGHIPLFFQIYSFFRAEIVQNQLGCYEFLPSIRSCAHLLDVSKNTVEVAYQLLISEGYVQSIPKKGYQVIYKHRMPPDVETVLAGEHGSESIQIDFRYGNIDLGTFPFKKWNQLRNKLITENQTNYRVEGLPQGEYDLRASISKLLHESRGVISTPEQIIIGASPQQLVSVLIQVLDRKKHVIGVENPGYDGSRNVFLNGGFEVNAIPLLDEGLSMDALQQSSSSVMYVSSSQQFRNKMVLSLEKRQALAQWAQSHEYIVEDDYEWEFKYQESYVPSIQSLSPEKVIYIGRLSKALLPVSNVSYLVLPYDLLAVFHRKVTEYDQPVSRLDQLTLTEYLIDGAWHKHLQFMRENYAEKRKTFLQAITNDMSGFVEIEGKDTGLHVFVTVKTTMLESELMERALAKGVKVYGTSRYWVEQQQKYPTLLLGYGALNHRQIQQGIRLVAEAWFQNPSPLSQSS